MKMKHRNAKSSQAEPPVLPERIDKTLQWLTKSRGSWKEKTQESKAKLKTTTLALKRAREERDKWTAQLREERVETQSKLSQKDNEIAILKKQLEQANHEVEKLKKKK